MTACNARTPGEWHQHANTNMNLASTTQGKAAYQAELSKRAHNECVNDNVSMYQDLHSILEKKVTNTHRLIEKLENRAKSTENSIEATRKSLRLLEQAHAEKDSPIRLCAWRMEQRDKRPLRECVRDNVEIALEEERGALVHTQEALSKNIHTTKNTIASLEGKLAELRHDLDQKRQANSVDELCLKTTQRSYYSAVDTTPRSQSARGSPTGPGSASTRLPSARRTGGVGAVAAEEESTRNEVKRQNEAKRLSDHVSKLEDAAQALRDQNAKLVAHCWKCMSDSGSKTTGALKERVSEIQQMLRRLVKETEATKKKEEKTKITINETRSHIQYLEEPKNLNLTHASWRKQRAHREQILDPVETRLEENKRMLMRTTEELRAHRQTEKCILNDLEEHLERLKEDVKDKTAAYNIDLQCLTISPGKESSRIGTSSRNRYESVMRRKGTATPSTPRECITTMPSLVR